MDSIDLISFVALGFAFRVSVATLEPWYIDDRGFCRYYQFLSVMFVSGDRPWNAVQLVIGPLMMSVARSGGGLRPEDYREG